MTKEHLEGRAEALGEVIATLDERLAKGCGTWAYELRQELARVKDNCERMAEKSTPDYERRKAYDEGKEPFSIYDPTGLRVWSITDDNVEGRDFVEFFKIEA